MKEELVATNVKTLRKQHKMTLQQLADLTGLTKGYLSRIERSKKPPPHSTVNRIAQALGVDTMTLLTDNSRSTEEFIASNVKALRKQHKMTLQQLADLTDLTTGYLSKIERSKKPPPYSTLNRIAQALGVDTMTLLTKNSRSTEDPRISFTKKRKGTKVENLGSRTSYTYEALSSDKIGKNMQPYVIESAFDEEAIFQHEGEEFLYVLEGKHEFVYDGRKYIMEEGDSVYFDSAFPHTGRSIGKKKAKLLAMVYSYKRI